MTSSLQNTDIIGNEQLKLILAEFKKNITDQMSASVTSNQLHIYIQNQLNKNFRKIEQELKQLIASLY